MAIKQRLLEKLERIAIGLERPAFAGNQRLIKGSIRRLTEARDLCSKGIASARYAAYGEIYDTLLLALTQNDVLSQAGTLALCRELLQSLISETRQEKYFKKEVVFLPYQASMWDSLESVWRAAAADTERAVAYVIPIPYAEFNPDHTVASWHCQAGLFPEDVPVLDWRDIDLQELRPDVIFVHNPYDGQNLITSVESRYYSAELKKVTDTLVYIPYYVYKDGAPGDRAFEKYMDPYIVMPVVRNADRTVVQSETMRQIYLQVLNRKHPMEEPGYWEERIRGLGSPKTDKVLRCRKEDFPLPPAWEKIIKGRKVILYNMSVEEILQYPDKLCKRLQYLFSLLRQRRDIALWWRPHPLTKGTLKSMRPQIEAEYLQLEQAYCEEGWGIYDDSPDLHQAICWSDAYYGANSRVLYLYQDTGKPMLLQDAAMLPPYAPFWMFDAAVDEQQKKLYFQAPVTNAVLSLALSTGALRIEHGFSDRPFISDTEWLYTCTFRVGDRLLFAPFLADHFMEYDLGTGREHIVPLPATDGSGNAPVPRFYGGVCHGGSIFLFGDIPAVVEYHVEERNVTYHPLPEELAELRHDKYCYYLPYTQHQGKLWFVRGEAYTVLSFDFESKAVQAHTIGAPGSRYGQMASDGESLWLYDMSAKLVRWNPVTDEYAVYALPQALAAGSFSGMVCNDSQLLLFPRYGSSPSYRLSFDKRTKEVLMFADDAGKDNGYLWVKALENQHVLAYEPHRGEFHEYDANGSLGACYPVQVDQDLAALWRKSLLSSRGKILWEREMIDFEAFLAAVAEGAWGHQAAQTPQQEKTIGKRIWEMVLDCCAEDR